MTVSNRQRLLAVLALVLPIAAGCGSDGPTIKPDQPAETLYNNGMNQLTAGDREEAVGFFEEVERQHPYSLWSNKAQIMAAYANYKMARFDEAIIGLDRFIRLHPGSRDIAYAYYLKALSYYDQIADIARDQSLTVQAQNALQEVIRRFPETSYASDARIKLDLTYDQLAGQEMTVGRWYERRGEYQAAINRFKIVVDKYQTTSHVPEALHRLTECYLALGLTGEAQKTAAVLGHNFPGNEWYVDSYGIMTGGASDEDDERSWFGQAWHSVF